LSYVARQLKPTQPSYESHNSYSAKRSPESSERNEKQGETDDLLTVREVSKTLRVDDTTTRRWIKSGSLEAIALPHRGKRQAYRIKRSTLSKILEGDATPG